MKRILTIFFALGAIVATAEQSVQTAMLGNLRSSSVVVTNVTGSAGVDTNAVRDLIAPATNAVFAAATNAVMARVEEKRDMTNRVWSVSNVWQYGYNGEQYQVTNTVFKGYYFEGNDTRTSMEVQIYKTQYGNGVLTEDDFEGYVEFGPNVSDHYHATRDKPQKLVITSDVEDSVRWWITEGTETRGIDFASHEIEGEEEYTTIYYSDTDGHLVLSSPYPIMFFSTSEEGVATTLTPDGSSVLTENEGDFRYLQSEATNGLATANALAAVSNEVANWSDYWTGDRVRLSVTNYYGNASGEPPRLRIEEAETNANGIIVGYRTVWDEVVRQTNYQHQITEQVADTSNAVMTAAYRQTYNQLANKAPRAWGTVTSAGAAAPANTVWVTEPRLVIAGGTEYAHVAVGTGAISVLAAHGQTPYTAGAEGQFRFCDESGENYFGFDVRSAYTIGCRTDGIEVNDQTHIVTLSYDLISAAPPTILHSTNLTTWAEAQVEWEQSPPTGQQVCYLNAGNAPSGFYKAQVNVAGGAKFLTNMQADLQGGIAATNEVAGVMQSVYPVITSTGVVWRVRQ